jgi:aspartyl-tRNA(Asn)/glutamyl-tRNA(Gln) amidotransferase subunit A
MVPAATGTDTGGSLRAPASACGVSSIKPTYGRVSAHGVIPLVWSLDHAGPMARSAADVALLLDAMAGPDERDPSTLAPPPPPATYLVAPGGGKPFGGLRIGVPGDAGSGLPAATGALWSAFLARLQDLGAKLVTITAPAGEPSILGALGEVWAYHQQFGPDAPTKYTPLVGGLVAASRGAAEASAADYLDYQRARSTYSAAWRDLLHGRDLVAVVKPGSTGDGVDRADAAGMTIVGGSVGGDYNWADAAGLPVAMTPIGRSAATGIPLGAQLGGAPHSEARLLELAIEYQAHDRSWAEAPRLA